MLHAFHRPMAWFSSRNRIGHLILLALLIVALAACGGKSEAQKAADALAAGLAAHQAGNLDEATKQYNECLKHDPTQRVCLYDLGVVAQTQNRAGEAENYYRLSLASDPNYPPSLFNLALLRSQAGSTQEAIDLYRHYVQVKPEDAGGHLNLGLLLRATGDTAGGDAELAEALRLNPALSIPAQAPAGSPTPSPAAGPSQSPAAASPSAARPSPSR